MRVILDTNVLLSAVFFGGVPGRILEAWRDGSIALIFSPSIFEEYRRIGEILAGKYSGLELGPILALLLSEGILAPDSVLPEAVSPDPDDDKFLSCALASNTSVIVSGDTDLLDVTGYGGIEVLRPREFVERHLDR